MKPKVLLSTSITPHTVAAATIVPTNFQASCFFGVVPIQYPILRSVTNEPAIERAVQTTPPIIRAAAIPALPLRPTATRINAAIINVINVIPLTGLVPTMAVALAATVVKRNAIMPTMRRPMMACQILLTTPPKAKNANTTRSAITTPKTTVFIGMSSSVRSDAVFSAPGFFVNSLAASLTADLMTPNDFIMPMMPAVAMPPMPICLAYSLKIWSADISPMVCDMPVPMRSIT